MRLKEVFIYKYKRQPWADHALYRDGHVAPRHCHRHCGRIAEDAFDIRLNVSGTCISFGDPVDRPRVWPTHKLKFEALVLRVLELAQSRAAGMLDQTGRATHADQITVCPKMLALQENQAPPAQHSPTHQGSRASRIKARLTTMSLLTNPTLPAQR